MNLPALAERSSQRTPSPSIGLTVAVLAHAIFLANANAQGAVATEKISFKVADAFEPGAAVVGELRVPDSKGAPLPAVMILNSSPGFDGRSAFYAEALTRAGIATFEIDMFQGRGIPATPRHNLPHAYESLQFLARRPRIDAMRIGIMGFSWGGIVSLLTSSDELTRQYAGGKLRFAAHLGLYPICWRQQTFLAGKDKHLKSSVYRKSTGRPVHILVGEKDGYDAPDACAKFLAALPAPVRRHFDLTVFPRATFAWDSRFDHASYDGAAKKGKGGIVDVIANSDVASQSREFAVAYFRRHLASD